ncbi:MAG: hypothetical protein ISS57_06645 [Anaerolineales bacterium]|nr:hypothetical protein [Anaerolineales bacterium]
MADLEMALENASWEMSYYLGLETGEILLVTDEAHSTLESIYEELDPQDDVELAIRKSDVAEWMIDSLLAAHQIEQGYRTRFIPIPRADSHEGYRDMEDFIETVQSEHLQEVLWTAIQGRGAFRRFKDVLLNYPEERKRWFEFSNARSRESAFDWLESLEIESIEEDEDGGIG